MDTNQVPTLSIPEAPTPPTPQKKVSASNGKRLLLIFFIIIVLIYAGIFYFYLFKPKETSSPVSQIPTTNIQPTSVVVNPTTDTTPSGELESYTNQDFGYSISFPKGTKYFAAKNIDKALPDFFGSFRIELQDNPKALEVNVFHNLGKPLGTVAEYTSWCKGLEEQLEKSNYRRRPGCTPTFSATQTELHGYKAFKSVISSPAQIVTIYYIPHGTRVYQVLTTYKQNDPTTKSVLDNISASFTFTK